MKLLTPARLAALVGVLTGLSAAVTAALNVIPHDTAIGRAVVASVGVLGTVITVAKFLEGQAGWEQQQSAQAHELNTQAIHQYHAEPVIKYGRVLGIRQAEHSKPKQEMAYPPEPVEDTAEVPLETVEDTGVVVDYANVDSGEPQRLHDQVSE